MRALLSLAGLLLVVYLVMKLSATQVQGIAPQAPTAGGGAASSAAQQAADKVTRAIEAGAAQRAADAASR